MIERTTKETQIRAQWAQDTEVATGIPFLDHMLQQFCFHGNLPLQMTVQGDLQVDDHHTVEDVAIVLGQLIANIQGRGMNRFGCAHVPMDDALARVVVDLSQRPFAVVKLRLKRSSIGGIAAENFEHFFQTLAGAARCNVHVDVIRGRNDHHKIEATFKALGLALSQALGPCNRPSNSTKEQK